MSVTYRPAGTSRGTVFFGAGHGGSDSGAVKYLVEKTVNLKQAMYGKDYMVAQGFTVVMSRNEDENDPLSEEIREANAVKNLLCAVDWHNNAGGGDGFECYYGIGSDMNGSKGLALEIEKQVKAIGQNSRGCKTRKGANGDYYGFIRQIKTRAVIVEGFFVDNANDVELFDTDAELKNYGYAVAKGIIAWLENTGRVAQKPQVKPSATETSYKEEETYTLQANMKVRAGAGTDYRQKKVSELTADGKKNATRRSGAAVLKKGTRVTCQKVVQAGEDVWIGIPSGYVCAKLGSRVYIR